MSATTASPAATNPLKELFSTYAQSAWLDYIRRSLISSGDLRQAYKGGANSGVFVQVTCDDKSDLQVPGQKYTFGVVKAAQARGDFQVLAERDRRALRVHLNDVEAGLITLQGAIQKAML